MVMIQKLDTIQLNFSSSEHPSCLRVSNTPYKSTVIKLHFDIDSRSVCIKIISGLVGRVIKTVPRGGRNERVERSFNFAGQGSVERESLISILRLCDRVPGFLARCPFNCVFLCASCLYVRLLWVQDEHGAFANCVLNFIYLRVLSFLYYKPSFDLLIRRIARILCFSCYTGRSIRNFRVNCCIC